MKHNLDTYKIILLVYVIFFGVYNSAILASNPEEPKNKILNEKEWKKLTEEVDFSENYKEFKQKNKKNNKTLKKRKKLDGFNFTDSSIVKTLLIILIIGILAFILYFVLVRYLNFFEERVSEKKLVNIIDNLEDNIHDSDFDQLLKQALNSKSYKPAIRILYLRLIKTLSDKELIKWKRNKTNGHYVREMASNPESSLFTYLTVAYEQAWFSNYDIDETKYNLISEQFTNLLNKLD